MSYNIRLIKVGHHFLFECPDSGRKHQNLNRLIYISQKIKVNFIHKENLTLLMKNILRLSSIGRKIIILNLELIARS